MKIPTAVVVFLLASSAIPLSAASIFIDSFGWGDGIANNGAADSDMPWGFIVDTRGSTFSSSVRGDLANLLNGYNLPSLASVNPIGSATIIGEGYYFIRAQTNSQTDSQSINGYFDTISFRLGASEPVMSGDAVGLMWFKAGTTVVRSGELVGFQNLATTLPADGNYNRGFSGDPSSQEFITIVPEPGLLGLTGLAALGLLRRRRP